MRCDIHGLVSALLFTCGSRKQTVGAVECIDTWWQLCFCFLGFFSHHSLSSSFRCEIIYVISFVLQVLLFDCIFSMRLLHQCCLERRSLLPDVLCFTLELCCLGLLWCDSGIAEYLEQTERWQEVSNSLYAYSGRERTFWHYPPCAAPGTWTALWLNCGLATVLCYPRVRGFVLQPCLHSPLWGVQECSNCETKPGGKLSEGPCSPLTEHG